MTDTTSTTFQLRYTVRATIDAPPERVWAVLTDAARFPSWNSTVTSLEGPIALGSRLTIRVPVAPNRAFRPVVAEFVPTSKMVWRDGFYPMFEGTRTFTLTARGAGTEFEMTELFRGLMLPMIRGSLPDFGPIFERYAADLKSAAERGA